jgi:hypothetical protein
MEYPSHNNTQMIYITQQKTLSAHGGLLCAELEECGKGLAADEKSRYDFESEQTL